ncbi:hypothetical protein MFIFM68171_08895 [Madurella fahalii]|uniref:Uncharacterized protein n=1 Tax=Madurella fahalii TaxID=1157608 RepID=A0ABQ0GLU4_9PEZI
MHSIGTATLDGEISQPVSPRTVLPEKALSGDRLTAAQSNEQGTREEVQSGQANMTKIRRSQHPPRLRTSISAARSRAASQHHVVSPTSNHMMAVQFLDPRPLEELHNERSYLLYNLQKQDDKSKRLFQKLATLDARLSMARTSSEAKRCQREAASIKAKIAESTQQEQLMTLRLGELHVELQNRGRWMQVHQLPLPHPPPSMDYMGYPPVLGSGEMVVSPHSDNSRSTADYFSYSSPLSPLSPTFIPAGGVPFSEDIWSRASGTSAGKETENGSLPPESVDEAEETSQSGPEAVGGERDTITEEGPENDYEVTRYESEADGDAPECEHAHTWRARLRRLSLHFPTSPKAKDRRMSVPYLKNLWPMSRRDSLQSSAAT